nr:DUF2807 domain-containing protein [Bacteroidota bacterium]
MKKQVLLIGAFLVTVFQFWGCDEGTNIWGQIKGSGNITSIDYSFDGFTRIDASYAFHLTVIQSDTFFVRLSVDDNVVEYLDVLKSGNWLVISLEDDKSYNNVHLNAEVHMPDIGVLKGSGASAIEMSGFSSAEDFLLELSGASVFSGSLECGDCEMQLSGASVVNMNGTCDQLNLEASGASELNMGNFICNTANLYISGATNATIHVTEHLSATLSGASVLRYYGDPEIGNLNISGASTIIKL